MLFAVGRLAWYDYLFLGLATLVVYPDKATAWIGDKAGFLPTRFHAVVFCLLAVGALVAAVTILQPIYPKVDWFLPLVGLGFALLFRGASWFVETTILS